jgi:integrase/recombinase XerD
LAGEAEELEDLGPSVLASEAVEFLNYMSVEKGSSANTIAAYRRVLRSYTVFLHEQGIVTPEDVSRASVEDFVSSLSSPEGKGLSARSVAQAASAVRMFHRFQVTDTGAGGEVDSISGRRHAPGSP